VINRYVISAGLLVIIVFASYIINFYFHLNYVVSTDSAVWGALGDYVGGILNPTLSFITIVLLIKSLTLQNAANISLTNELKNSEKTEKTRSFESLFFNMLNSQKELFIIFKYKEDRVGTHLCFVGVEAVIEIEDQIEQIRYKSLVDQDITKFLEGVDLKDQLFGLTRSFYVMVKMITDKLSEENGFNEEDRKAHFSTLINFTDFSLIRLIMISVQFMDYHSTNYLKEHKEFKDVIEELGLSYNLY
jgi:hypothetical protein